MKGTSLEWAVVVAAFIAAVLLLVWQVPGNRADLLAGQKIDWPNQRQP